MGDSGSQRRLERKERPRTKGASKVERLPKIESVERLGGGGGDDDSDRDRNDDDDDDSGTESFRGIVVKI